MFVHRLRVLYGDTDTGGIVYHANYLRFFEAARAEFLRSAGIPYASIEADGYLWPVVESWLRHRRPAHYDDLLEIAVGVESVKGAQAAFFYEVNRDGELLCDGLTRLACTRRGGGVVRMPLGVRTALEERIEPLPKRFQDRTLVHPG